MLRCAGGKSSGSIASSLRVLMSKSFLLIGLLIAEPLPPGRARGALGQRQGTRPLFHEECPWAELKAGRVDLLFALGEIPSPSPVGEDSSRQHGSTLCAIPANICSRQNRFLKANPDKVADRISDTVLDAYLAADPYARVACETLVTTNRIVLAGETRGPDSITAEYLAHLARMAVHDIGYDQAGFLLA